MPKDKHRYSEAVGRRIFDQLEARRSAEKVHRAGKGLIGRTEQTKQRMLRAELIDMLDDEDAQRYHIIQNDVERYEVKDEKVSFIRGSSYVEWKIFVRYYEIGENLPLHKTKAQLRADDADRIAKFNQEEEDDEPFTLGDDMEDMSFGE